MNPCLMIIAPRRNKLIWNPDELKLLVDKTIKKIVACPFKQGRSFLHHIVADLFDNDEEVKASVRRKEIVSYESLRDSGFIPAFHKAWEKIHQPPQPVTVNVVGVSSGSAEVMPLHKLLEITRRRIAEEFEPMAQDPGLGQHATRALLPKLAGLVEKKLTKATLAIVVSPNRFGTQVSDLRRRVSDVLDLDLVTEKTVPEISSKTTQMVMLAQDPTASIHRIGAHLVRALRKTNAPVEIVQQPNWRAIQDYIIQHAATVRREMGMV